MMTDLSKRLCETLATGLYDDENGNPLTYHPATLISIIREAAAALDARGAEVRRLRDAINECRQYFVRVQNQTPEGFTQNQASAVARMIDMIDGA